MISHTVGENQELYKRYGISGGEHIPETEALCEIVRQLEERIKQLEENIDDARQHFQEGNQ